MAKHYLDGVLSAESVANVLGIDERRVRELLADGKLYGRQLVKGVWMVYRKDAEAFARTFVKRPRGRPPKE